MWYEVKKCTPISGRGRQGSIARPVVVLCQVKIRDFNNKHLFYAIKKNFNGLIHIKKTNTIKKKTKMYNTF